MMSLSKMAPLAWRYYAEEVAAGREDYFAAGAERPGRFLGRGAEMLGIADLEVTSEAMERLFGRGCDPRSGAALGRSFSPEDERAVAGFALTFSPPKTVSVLWALGDQAVSSAVLSAHEAAVEKALAFLEDHAAFTRRGHGGISQVDTDGLVAASFVHRTSRASDPQLHTHVLVANKVRAKDGHWLSLHARELFCHQKAAGMLYKAALRAELTARCGVSWTFVDDNGIAEVEGVPDELCAAWSARRQAVKAAGDSLVAEREAALGRPLTSSERASCFQVAAYRTRTPKIDAETPTEVLKERWHEEAVGFGHDPARWLAGVLGHGRAVVATPGVEELPSVLARLEERSATWTRADVVEECARLVDAHDAEGVRRAMEALADEVLRDPEVVSLEAPLPVEAPAFLQREDGMAQFERHGGRRFSTTGTLRREAAALEAAAAGAGAGVGIAPEAVVTSAITDARLCEDQEAAVPGLLAGGEQLALLVGPAGSGKSRALWAARAA
jgi:conjugative relaxase-like TrwC/TraI family protein